MAPNPYGHVGIPTDHGRPRSFLDTPIFHDGSKSGDLLSGELRCTLTALTPLIVGNHQYKMRDVDGARPVGNGETFTPPGTWPDYLQGLHISAGKTILEPLWDKEHGRVLIPGTAIKGMITQSLGALLAAPMARVEERSFSYRPNLDFPGPNARLQPRPAIVESWDPTTEHLTLQILPATAMRNVYFVHNDVLDCMSSPIPRDLSLISPIRDAALQPAAANGRSVPKLCNSQGKYADLSDYYFFEYFGGVDGTGTLARAFGMRGVYRGVVIPKSEVPASDSADYVSLTVDAEVLKQHQRTLDHLADPQEGHLRNEHPLSSKFGSIVGQLGRDIRAGADHIRQVDTLIYVEVETADDVPTRILSLGQNLRYRWRYRDTVRTVWSADGPAQRKTLVPLPEETTLVGEGQHKPPEKLSAVRLLTGYVKNRKSPWEDGLGVGDFEQLAGRIAPNMAVEQDWRDARISDRFLLANDDCVVPLKVLGLPRASAEIEYLMQRTPPGFHGEFVSYGDTLDAASSELAGRKFYRHQSAAAGNWIFRAVDGGVDEDILTSDQAIIARYISKPKRQFRFTLRFRDLRPWELGAVMACLRPGLAAADTTDLVEPENLRVRPEYAVKLGHGRPLGLGSVRIDIDDIVFLDAFRNEDQPVAEPADRALDAVGDFRDIIASSPGLGPARNRWLDLCRYAGTERADYHKDNHGQIYGYYTGLRRVHSRRRRE